MTPDIPNKPASPQANTGPSSFREPKQPGVTAQDQVFADLATPEQFAPAVSSMLSSLPEPVSTEASTTAKFGAFSVGEVTVSFRRGSAA